MTNTNFLPLPSFVIYVTIPFFVLGYPTNGLWIVFQGIIDSLFGVEKAQHGRYDAYCDGLGVQRPKAEPAWWEHLYNPYITTTLTGMALIAYGLSNKL
jgi:hypothetical protein